VRVIDDVDRQLTSWVGEIVPGATVTLDGPDPGTTADVGLHLFELSDLPPARGVEQPPLQVLLGYLVTTWGADTAAAHKRLGDLLFAALQSPDYEVRFPAVTAFWNAANVPPRPSFVLTVPLRQAVDRAPAPPVLSPLRLKAVGSHTLDGVVLGPGDVTIADAFVEIPALELSTRADTRGRFRFAAVPAGPTALQLRVSAKAQEFPFTVDSSAPQPVTLRLDLAKG
jgi:hypothetical protein